MDTVLAFALAALALTGSPGPATLGLAATGAAFGGARGLGFMAGICSGMVVVMAVTASGVTGAILAVPGAAPLFGLAGAAYIAYLAYRIATAPPLGVAAAARAAPSYLGGIFLALVNPKAYAAMAALFSGFVLIPERLLLDATVKLLGLLAMIVCVNLAWLFAGAALTRFLHEPRLSRAINIAFAVLLVVSVLLTVTSLEL